MIGIVLVLDVLMVNKATMKGNYWVGITIWNGLRKVKRPRKTLFQVFIRMPTGRSVVVRIDECTRVEDLVPRKISDVARCYITY